MELCIVFVVCSQAATAQASVTPVTQSWRPSRYRPWPAIRISCLAPQRKGWEKDLLSSWFPNFLMPFEHMWSPLRGNCSTSKLRKKNIQLDFNLPRFTPGVNGHMGSGCFSLRVEGAWKYKHSLLQIQQEMLRHQLLLRASYFLLQVKDRVLHTLLGDAKRDGSPQALPPPLSTGLVFPLYLFINTCTASKGKGGGRGGHKMSANIQKPTAMDIWTHFPKCDCKSMHVQKLEILKLINKRDPGIWRAFSVKLDKTFNVLWLRNKANGLGREEYSQYI